MIEMRSDNFDRFLTGVTFALLADIPAVIGSPELEGEPDQHAGVVMNAILANALDADAA